MSKVRRIFKRKLWTCRSVNCGWTWFSALERPGTCPKCRSPYFDKPYTKGPYEKKDEV